MLTIICAALMAAALIGTGSASAQAFGAARGATAAPGVAPGAATVVNDPVVNDPVVKDADVVRPHAQLTQYRRLRAPAYGRRLGPNSGQWQPVQGNRGRYRRGYSQRFLPLYSGRRNLRPGRARPLRDVTPSVRRYGRILGVNLQGGVYVFRILTPAGRVITVRRSAY